MEPGPGARSRARAARAVRGRVPGVDELGSPLPRGLALSVLLLFLFLLLLLRLVARLVLRGPHEEHGAVAGAVLSAMLAPVLGVARRNMKIERRDRLGPRVLHDDHRPLIEHRQRRRTAAIHPSVPT